MPTLCSRLCNNPATVRCSDCLHRDLCKDCDTLYHGGHFKNHVRESIRTCHFCPINPKPATIRCTECAKEEVFLCTICHHKLHEHFQHKVYTLKRQREEETANLSIVRRQNQGFPSVSAVLEASTESDHEYCMSIFIS